MKNIHIKTTLPSVLLLALPVGSANAAFSLYTGGHLSYTNLNTHLTAASNTAALGGDDKTALAGHGMQGGVHLAAHFFPDHYKLMFLGLEGAATLSKVHSKDERAVSYHSKGNTLKMHGLHSLSLAIKAGPTLANNILLYLKAGLVSSQFKVQSSYNLSPLVVHTTAISQKKKTEGFLIGLGIEVPLNQALSLGFEGIHTQYKPFTVRHSHILTSADYTTYRLRPKSHTFNVKLSWKIYGR